jgi:hypothetical protein
MKSLTICYITARQEPKFEWFFSSLYRQWKTGEPIEIIAVDLYNKISNNINPAIRAVLPKSTVWQGEHRLTKVDWWAISNARNTGACLCETEWIAFVDDRCVLVHTWLNSIRQAMEGNYAVAGSYEKRVNMKVEDGVIIEPGEIIGVDFRNPKRMVWPPMNTYGGDWFGCTSALPLEWVLEQNGHDENCDSLGLEDVIFGNRLAQNGRITKFDPAMKIIEDRTPYACENMPKRTDKGVSPNDRSHAVLSKFGGGKRASHGFDIRAVRNDALAGKPWPLPWGPTHDFWDNEPLGEMTVR